MDTVTKQYIETVKVSDIASTFVSYSAIRYI